MTNEEIEKTIKEARDSGAKRYYLRNEKLSELPESICTLTEVEEISLIGNKLTKLPVKFGALKNLIRLHLSDNSFETIPPEIFLLPKLTHVCIRANKIKLLPENIGELKSIRDIDLDSNRISSIPLTTENIDIIDNLSVLDNPILDPPFQILQQGKEALKLYVEKKGKVLLYTDSAPIKPDNICRVR